MKPPVKLLAVFLLTATFFICNSPKAYVQPAQHNYLQITTSKIDWDQYTVKKKKAPFFVTFCRTPFALVTAAVTLVCLLVILVFEFLANVFTGFSYKYPVSNEIKAIGWDGVTADWWWNPGQTWHLWFCIFLWIFLSGATQRNK